MSSDISSRTLNISVDRHASPRVSAGDFIVWISGFAAAGWWTISIVNLLISKMAKTGSPSLETVLLKNSGLTALVVSTTLICILSLIAAVAALRGKRIAQPSASVVIVTAMALRAIQLIYQTQASTMDADILAGLMLVAGLLYFGSGRLWWAVLMPLGTAACFAPLVWLEFFKGASHASLMRALISPAAAFGLTSILIVSRELRSRTQMSLNEMSSMQSRGVNLKKQMHAMENDLKSLLSIVSISRPAVLLSSDEFLTETASSALEVFERPLEELGETSFQPVDAGPAITTEFVPESQAMLSPESSTYEDLDRAAREVLDEARARAEDTSRLEGKKSVRLLLTAPVGATVPLAVRGSRSSAARWMKALVANSIDSLGGFPDGVVRVTLRPGLTSVVISIEDNGRGFNDDLLTKLGAASGERMTSLQVRKEVEAVGGRFDIQARLGVGARLTIELPRIDRAGSKSESKFESKSVRPNDYRPYSSNSLHA